MNKKEFKKYMQQGLGRCVLILQSSNNIEQKDIIKKAIHNETSRILDANASPSSQINSARSKAGTVLTELVSRGDVKVDKDKKYFLGKEELVIVQESECRGEILRLLKSKSLKRADLYLALQKKFGTDQTKSKKDDNGLRSMAGQILAREIDNGRIVEQSGLISLAVEKTPLPRPITPTPENKTAPISEEKFEELFLSRIHELGGKFFEHFVANMLEKYYTVNGREVLVCEVTGGSEDGGIDVIMETKEQLGFVERIMIQAKNRRTIRVTEKEVREFYGEMYAQRGTRGIYITTSSFCESAEKFLNSLPDCVAIDGKKVFEIAKQVAYGIQQTKSGLAFDPIAFS